MQADSIKIESEDDGFHLVIDGYDPSGKYRVAEFNFNIHSCAEALHEQVNLIIGGWLAEEQSARREFHDTRAEDAAAYMSNDPKHPAFHSVHADLWDSRSEK